jgi:hypothetical protein
MASHCRQQSVYGNMDILVWDLNNAICGKRDPWRVGTTMLLMVSISSSAILICSTTLFIEGQVLELLDNSCDK